MGGATASTALKLKMMPLFFLLASCLGQDRGGTHPSVGRAVIGGVFSKAKASGSLEYWGVCDFKNYYPDFPKLRAVPGPQGSAVELLREMFFVDDPEMRVSQDADGRIRMIEEDVPSDLLDVRIPHLQFTGEYHGIKFAIVTILKTPEVIAFRKEHKIGPESDWGPGFSLNHSAFAPEVPRVLGDLHDVTVRQALDYILQTVQGFWLYENCKNSEGGRNVIFGLIENVPDAALQQR
jgi:hypothetical protein